jgi:hypothetical protein
MVFCSDMDYDCHKENIVFNESEPLFIASDIGGKL